MRHILIAGAAALVLAACGNTDTSEPETAAPQPPAAEPAPAPETAPETETVETGSMEWAVTGDWRSEADRERDFFRSPARTLRFFGVKGDETVVEIWPGGGWYTEILAPYLNANGGTLIAAGFDPDAFEGERATQVAERVDAFAERFAANPDLYGTIEMSEFSNISGPLAPEGSVDVVLTFRNIHNWMSGDYLDKFFDDAFAALKPGGTLGVVEHRLPSAMEQDPTAASGYVHEDVVKAAAERAGFEFVASSEINANPKDTADHPFGVWTLPPNNRTTDADGNTPEGFDAEAYAQIGESDRMTLRFRKPAAE